MSRRSAALPIGRLVAFAFRAAVGITIVGVAAAVFFLLRSTKPEPPRAEIAERVLNASVMTVAPVDAPRVWRGYGTARAKRAADVAAEVDARVVDRPDATDPGRAVARGQTLVELEADEFIDRAAQIDQRIADLNAQVDGLDVETEVAQRQSELAQEALDLLNGEIDRLRRAIDSGSASAFELDRLNRDRTGLERELESIRQTLRLIPVRRSRLESQRLSEQAALRLARLDVERTTIDAPFAGVLQTVDVQEGDYVRRGGRVARVVDLSVIEVPVRLPLSASTDVAVGDEVLLTAASEHADPWRGAIARVAPEADAATRTITVFAEVRQTAGGPADDRGRDVLAPGTFLTARVVGGDRSRRLVVPRAAVIGDRVMLVNDEDRAEPRVVDVAFRIEAGFPELHPSETQWAVVGGGLDAGDRVILSNLGDLRAGVRVSPSDVRAAADEPGRDRPLAGGPAGGPS